MSIPQLTKLLLKTFAVALNDQALESQVEQYYDSYISDSGDLGEQLYSFFLNLLKQHGETQTLLILKAIQQKIIFPAYYCMREYLEPNLGSFKDVYGSWVVQLEIDGDVVVVKHIKQQQSITTRADEIPDYQFTWQLVIPVNIVTKSLVYEEIRIEFIQISVNEHLEERVKNQIRDSFKEIDCI